MGNRTGKRKAVLPCLSLSMFQISLPQAPQKLEVELRSKHFSRLLYPPSAHAPTKIDGLGTGSSLLKIQMNGAVTAYTEAIIMSCFFIRGIPALTKISHELPPTFLAPALASSRCGVQQISGFSTSAASCARHKAYKKRRDGNPNRGESALRRTGLRFKVGMSKEELPQPVLDPSRRSKVQVDPNHGLWGFFNREKQALTKPEDDYAHGRAAALWRVQH